MTLRWLTPLRSTRLGSVALLGACAPLAAMAVSYGTAEDTAHRAFPGATAVKDVLVTPGPDAAKALAAPGAPPRMAPVRLLEVRQGDRLLGRVVVDGVVGKFEQIDYAVALGADGRIVAVDILAYRESHGAEVRLPAWRNQFVGKGPGDPLRLGTDIANISGATLSCTHLTEGIHRVVAFAAALGADGAASSPAS